MALTTISDRLTPSVPIQITLGNLVNVPSANQNVLIYGHASATTPASALYTVYNVANSASVSAATTELGALYGPTSEIVTMVVAAINANALGLNVNFPQLKVVALASTDTGFGSANVALTNALTTRQEFIVNPYDAMVSNANALALIAQATLLSGPDRGAMSQFGSTVVQSAVAVAPSSSSTLTFFGTQNVVSATLPSIGEATAYTAAQLSAANAAAIAANAAPFDPMDSVVVGGVPAPVLQANQVTVGAGLVSETILAQGWTPMKVTAAAQVAFVRTITGRVMNALNTGDAYIDVQDWQVLYLWRNTLYTRFTQPDFSNVKASQQEASSILGELIRLAKLFETQNMFEDVTQLAPLFKVARGVSDRSRFDAYTPLNVIPGLHVLAINAQAGTLFDSFNI